LTSFSDHRFPPDTPDHISLPQYVNYLHSYVEHFALEPFLRLGCPVTSIEPLEKSTNQQWKHRVKYTDKLNGDKEGTFDCSHIAICTGLHVEPNIPTIPGIEHINGEVFHSSQYKKRSQLTGRDVLVMGCGETAMGTC
jgi:dimethylaniline monooxygenase (N-oxide forming)